MNVLYVAKNLNNYLHADFLFLFKRLAEKKKPFAFETVLLKHKVKVKIVVSPVHECRNK